MKKIFFLTLLLAVIIFPIVALVAQDNQKGVLEDMLIDETASKTNAMMSEQEIVKEIFPELKASEAPTPNENTTPSNVEVIEQPIEKPEAQAIAQPIEQAIEEPAPKITPRNPETEIMAPKKQTNDIEYTHRQNTPMDAPIKETTAAQTTHPQLNLTPDKSEMIRLSEKAASVVVGNPNHISVLLDTPDTIIVVPRQQGASHFTVIGESGNIIMQRHAVVELYK